MAGREDRFHHPPPLVMLRSAAQQRVSKHAPGARTESLRSRPACFETALRASSHDEVEWAAWRTPGPTLDSNRNIFYRASVLFAEGRSREASTGRKGMRRLRAGFANPHSGSRTSAALRVLRPGRQCSVAERAGGRKGRAVPRGTGRGFRKSTRSVTSGRSGPKSPPVPGESPDVVQRGLGPRVKPEDDGGDASRGRRKALQTKMI
jgi:hypothetical protein